MKKIEKASHENESERFKLLRPRCLPKCFSQSSGAAAGSGCAGNLFLIYRELDCSFLSSRLPVQHKWSKCQELNELLDFLWLKEAKKLTDIQFA